MLATIFTLTLLISISACHNPTEVAAVTWSWKNGYDIHPVGEENSVERKTYVAWGNFSNAINETGWSFLDITTNKDYPDKIQAYAAGLLEGRLTANVLYMYWQNTVDGYCAGKEKLCEKLAKYVDENTAWVHKKLAGDADPGSNPYWHHVSLVYEQLRGLHDGYASAAKAGLVPKLGFGDIFWMNIFGDLEDLESVFDAGNEFNRTRVFGSGSCSALIKVLPDNSDLYVAHDTWNSYQSMLRVLKKYSFNFHWSTGPKGRKKLIPGHTMAFSSYPGVVYSGDDFTLISTGLAVTETTIGNSNPELWKFVKAEGQVLEGIRSMVANRLSTNGKTWAKIFARRNSGTYNNQWMVVDYKRFKPNKPIGNTTGLLWVLEQLPGHVHMEDLTKVLASKSYWPSYNTPYFKDIFNLSGSPEKVAKYGNWFSYDKTPRALIFKRDHKTVRDMDSMTKLMRYNNFKADPLSKCDCDPPFSGENAISARNDLNPATGRYPFAALGHRSHGGTDMKLTNSKLLNDLEFVAFGGPTYDDLPPFQWSKTDFFSDTPHYGHPDVWRFEPVTHKWNTVENMGARIARQ